ncbi:MFS transporter [Enemella evansiae]|uniref:MFS transporter n=1 Tax=Enemella evansiae TaxID=2016499 RepID=UPI000B969610|nr:MFS transporter [Enemella evansiae]OYO11083.1 MFS transporter [Enemella evansiae]
MTVKNSSDLHSRHTAGPVPGVIAVLGLAAFLAVLDGTAVTASLQTLAAAFGGELSLLVWVTSAYLMAAGTSLPLVGWASDRFGGRAVFLTGLAAFVAGSALSGLAWSAPVLIAARVVQGLGGGLLEPAAMAVAAALAPRNAVGKVMSRFSLVINIAPIVGPLVGTVLGDAGWWRWIFLLNLPIGLVILVTALRWVPAAAGAGGSGGAAPDLRGMALLTPGFVGLLLALNRWGAGAAGGQVLLLGLAGCLLLAGYVGHALRMSGTPVLDLRLLRSGPFRAALLAMCTVGVLMYTQLTVLPLVVEERFGITGLARSLLTVSLGVGLLLSMARAGGLSDSWGPRRLVVGGGIGTALGFGVFALVASSWPLWAAMLLFALIGLAFGCVAAPTFASVYRTLQPEQAAQGTTAMFMAVQGFAAVGATVTGVVAGAGPELPVRPLFLGLAVVAAIAALLGGRLPGPPSATESVPS